MIRKFTDKIGDKYKNWKKSNIILLNGATGSGKTYFILHILSKYAKEKHKKILFLCNREKLTRDIQVELDLYNIGNVDVMTYQLLSQIINNDNKIKSNYSYIVYDECHYFTGEGWNQTTDIIWNFFKNNKDKYINVFMSGTGNNIFQYLRKKYNIEETHEYIIPYDYSYVDKLIFYYSDDTVENIFNNLKEGEKVIYFSLKLDRAYELYEKYKDKANFFCSNSCKYKDFREDCIKTYDKNLITFEKQILITTTVLDVGITLKDRNIKYIIADLVDVNQLQQCLGRKRVIDDNDTCQFWIKNHSKRTLNGFCRTMKNSILNDADDYYSHREEFIKKSKKDRKLKLNPCFQYKSNEIDNTKEANSIIGELEFNYYTYIYYNIQYYAIEKCINNGFESVILEQLGNTIKNYEFMEDIEKAESEIKLGKYLESLVGKMLFTDERKELILTIGLKDAKNRIQKSIQQLNAYLNANKYEYIIINKEDKRRKLEDGSDNPNRCKRFWEVVKIIKE